MEALDVEDILFNVGELSKLLFEVLELWVCGIELLQVLIDLFLP